ncbi:hypothetical protein D3C83_41260 [compost metagenome]
MVGKAGAGAAHHDALLGARRQVDVVDVAPGLADQFQRGDLLGDRARKSRPPLEQDHGFRTGEPPGELRGILHGIPVGDDVVAFQLPRALERAKRVLVIIQYGDLHGWPHLVERDILQKRWNRR